MQVTPDDQDSDDGGGTVARVSLTETIDGGGGGGGTVELTVPYDGGAGEWEAGALPCGSAFELTVFSCDGDRCVLGAQDRDL